MGIIFNYKSEKEKCQEAFEKGSQDGKNGYFLTDFSQSLSKGFSANKPEKSYDAGYDKGSNERVWGKK